MDPAKNLYDSRLKLMRKHYTSRENTMLSPAYRRKKYALYLMRTFCVAALYFLFWEYTWVRFTLILYVPLNFFFLFCLVGWRYFLERKVQRMREELG
ncbi:hypothetical protein [Lewinella sp. IMCC34183]|uniref:hypothetical protein n=1 Tax=Lewinella sp. IMCC34183 TaxID=2248762 RepID=UPI000E25C558|nr:hypothetical protein [Lewinella sp. IMCC34183]